jgi:hypothetical protein
MHSPPPAPWGDTSTPKPPSPRFPFNLTPTPLPRERGYITDIQNFTSPSLLGEGERGGEVDDKESKPLPLALLRRSGYTKAWGEVSNIKKAGQLTGLGNSLLIKLFLRKICYLIGIQVIINLPLEFFKHFYGILHICQGMISCRYDPQHHNIFWNNGINNN